MVSREYDAGLKEEEVVQLIGGLMCEE